MNTTVCGSFLFVATDERGPGGMRPITGTVEDWDKVRRQVPWAGPPPPCIQEEKFSNLIV